MLGLSSHPFIGGLDARYCYCSIPPVSLLNTFHICLQLFLVSFFFFGGGRAGSCNCTYWEGHGKMDLWHHVWTGNDLWHSSCSVNLRIHKHCIESQSSGRACQPKYLGKSPSDSDQEKNYTDKLLLLTHAISKHGVMF